MYYRDNNLLKFIIAKLLCKETGYFFMLSLSVHIFLLLLFCLKRLVTKPLCITLITTIMYRIFLLIKILILFCSTQYLKIARIWNFLQTLAFYWVGLLSSRELLKLNLVRRMCIILLTQNSNLIQISSWCKVQKYCYSIIHFFYFLRVFLAWGGVVRQRQQNFILNNPSRTYSKEVHKFNSRKLIIWLVQIPVMNLRMYLLHCD